ncbi:MAG: heat-shock protein HtpX, partial [Candidatus Electrothrix sp. AR3]|nr:heat-shock protein HtpX [Candidatus Electrothrix sp. AR3]
MLTGWFSWTAYRLISGGFEPGGHIFLGILTGLPAAFFAIFLIKALFFIKRGHNNANFEITEKEEPRLFEFLNQLADEAGAPRPHKVFISYRVNATVFYDLSPLNFFFPAKKNLEIGLGLVNVLDLGELKAVLAHEFGHFAQKSLAIGSWVYIARQVAAHIIAQRDIFDKFIHGFSNIDLCIGWIGWILRLIVWSIRSLMDSAFSLVILAERALSREMEFQADLVAVSLTGSDALIHALHKLHAADEAWDRTLVFVNSEAINGRAVTDFFMIQRRIIQIIGTILNNPDYGKTPPLPKVNPQDHRVFKSKLASPPKMWSTHPENAAREKNAKKIYVAAQIDKRSAWSIFRNHVKICAEISQQLIDTSELATVTTEESIAHLDKQYKKIYYNKKFRGVYLGRDITRYADNVSELYDDYKSLQDIDQELAGLYPKSLSAHLARLKILYEEKYTLEGIQAKVLQIDGKVIRHRGKNIKRKNLPSVIEDIKAEITETEETVQKHDIRCRTVHLAIAHHVGKQWEDNLLGLLALLHYTDHSEANLRDVYGYMDNIV